MSKKRPADQKKLSARLARKPSLEQLEGRTLLSVLPTSTVVTPSTVSVIAGGLALFSAVVSSSEGIVQGGSVEWFVNGVAYPDGDITEPNVGSYSITAQYLGFTFNYPPPYENDSVTFAPSVSAAATLNVTQAATSTFVTPYTAFVTAGQSETFTALFNIFSPLDGTPSDGSVQFLVNGSDYGSAVPVSDGQAQQSVAEPVGSYQVTAQYLGDGTNYAASTIWAAATLIVTQAAPDIAMSSASEVSATSVSVDYAINNAAVTEPLQFNVYQSMTSPPTSGAFSPVFPGDLFVGSATLPSTDTQDLSMGPHNGVILNLGSSALETNPNYPYVVVVANPPGATHVPESDDPIDQNDTTFFQLPDIALLDVTTYNDTATGDQPAYTIFKDFQVDYSIANSASPAFVLRAYLSPSPNFDPSDQPLGETMVGTGENQDQPIQPNSSESPEYEWTLELPGFDVRASADHYIIVVADPDGMIAETSKTNNNLFAIPILDSGDAIDGLGEEGLIGASGQSSIPSGPKEISPNASGPYTGPIVPGTDAYSQLQSLVTTWQVSPLFQFLTNYPSTDTPTLISQKEAEERLGQSTLLHPLATLVTLIQLDTQMHPDFWQGVIFSINAAYDSTGAHGKPSSLHYEGRAIDIQPVGGVLSQRPDQIGRLAGLAWLAGFDWSYAEPPHSDPTGPANHLHVSMQSAESVNDVSSQVSAIASGLVYNRSTQLFGGTITLTNNGATALTGTLVVVLTNIPSGVTLANADGETAARDPYILVDLLELDSGQSIKFTVLFSNPQKRSFQYGTSIFDE